MTFTTIGTRPIRHDGVDKVTGRAVYGAATAGAQKAIGHDRTSANAARAASIV